jgi:hypothetical protein
MNEIDTVVLTKPERFTNCKRKFCTKAKSFKKQTTNYRRSKNLTLSRMVANHLVNFPEEAFTISGFEEIKGNGLKLTVKKSNSAGGNSEFWKIVALKKCECARALDGNTTVSLLSVRVIVKRREVLGDLKASS